ncbi:RidA family protein [Arcicella rosea]|uniref:Enamine deaminase RidA (YjgF/YER057c/UK114 family) n=1 Tax=Arcicella rosea TaxID=502909 RepID=A0A841ENE2_9BACT|nr:RidA family protein [Arcicella rosea]MBB6004426.1 enamine deaminase RidA (YjgF/YER057c/UK114 family) [Arcicella rosea]
MKKLLLLCLLFFCAKAYAQTPEEQLTKLGITLPAISQPVASYVNVVRSGNLLFLSGKGPLKTDGQYIKGKLGKDLTIEEGAKAAELAAIQQLAVLKATLGDLNKVKRIVKVLGFVNSDSEFFEHPKVINGTSNLMIQVFGEKGKHARSALGVSALPFNMAVEVEMIVEVE